MKVFIITETSFPHGFAATSRIRCYAKSIIGEGVECVVIPYSRTEKTKAIDKPSSGNYEGIPYYYISHNNVFHSNPIVRKIVFIHDCFRVLVKMLYSIDKGDVVLLYHTYLVFAPLLALVTHFKKGHIFTDVCELPYGVSEQETSWMRFKRKVLFKCVFPHIDGFISISQNLTNLIRVKCHNARVLQIPILVEYNKFNINSTQNGENAPYIFHAGKHEEIKDGFVSMIEAFCRCCINPDFKGRFVSTGKLEGTMHEKEIVDIINKYSAWDRVEFTGILSETELKKFLNNATMVIINKKENNQNKYCFPTKLGEYMAAGKPIIITDYGEAANWLTHGVDSFIVPHDNVNELMNGILRLMNDKTLLETISKGAQKTCKTRFSYDLYGESIINFFSFKL